MTKMFAYIVYAKSGPAEKAIFSKDAFSWPAFFFGPAWLLRHRAWIVLAMWLILHVGILFLLRTGTEIAYVLGLEFIIAILLGLEAGSIQEFSLRRRGFVMTNVVRGKSLQEAEYRHFGAMTDPHLKQEMRKDHVNPSPDMVGLFPSFKA
jgi:hypothetical protein